MFSGNIFGDIYNEKPSSPQITKSHGFFISKNDYFIAFAYLRAVFFFGICYVADKISVELYSVAYRCRIQINVATAMKTFTAF